MAIRANPKSSAISELIEGIKAPESVSREIILARKANLERAFAIVPEAMLAQMLAALRQPSDIPSVHSSDFPKWTKETRERLQISSGDLARAASVNPCAISYLENGTRPIGIGRRQKILDALKKEIAARRSTP